MTWLLSAALLAGATRVAAQECNRLQSATSSELVSFLQGSTPAESNADCFAFAIDRLGEDRYEQSVPILVSLLAFRRPPTEPEKHGTHIRMGRSYPSVVALEEIGKSALPALLGSIKDESTPAVARENAVSVWMEIYKYESPTGVMLLRREAEGAVTDTERKNLNWAISKALTWCNPPDEEKCKEAARPRE